MRIYNQSEHDLALAEHDRAYAVLEKRREQSGRGSADWQLALQDVRAAAQRVREASPVRTRVVGQR
jgi:hypothetical protein